jgi:hypothetical protein
MTKPHLMHWLGDYEAPGICSAAVDWLLCRSASNFCHKCGDEMGHLKEMTRTCCCFSKGTWCNTQLYSACSALCSTCGTSPFVLRGNPRPLEHARYLLEVVWRFSDLHSLLSSTILCFDGPERGNLEMERDFASAMRPIIVDGSRRFLGVSRTNQSFLNWWF